MGFFKRRAAVVSVGCKVNRYDAVLAEKALSASGYDIVGFPDTADVYVINTCAVTGEAAKKSRNAVRRAVSLNPGAVVAVAGCWSELERDAAACIPGVDIVLGTHDYSDIANIIGKCFEDKNPDDRKCADTGFLEQAPAPARAASLSRDCLRTPSDMTRAYLKIQDGCGFRCSYCVIPMARGAVRSRTIEEIVREAEEIARTGVKEIVISGICVASYGNDLCKTSYKAELPDVLEALDGVSGIERLRLSSLSPQAVDTELVRRLKGLKKLCEFFHLSLQSGCAKTLKAMRRSYTPDSYFRAVEHLKGAFPDCAVWSDVIAGFPGETERDFEESCDFIKRSGIVKLHIFPFSAKKGTEAYDMPGKVPKSEKSRRVAALKDIDRELYSRFLNERLGRRYEVLLERGGRSDMKGLFTGHTSNNIAVLARLKRFDEDAANKLCDIMITEICPPGRGVDVYGAEVLR